MRPASTAPPSSTIRVEASFGSSLIACASSSPWRPFSRSSSTITRGRCSRIAVQASSTPTASTSSYRSERIAARTSRRVRQSAPATSTAGGGATSFSLGRSTARSGPGCSTATSPAPGRLARRLRPPAIHVDALADRSQHVELDLVGQVVAAGLDAEDAGLLGRADEHAGQLAHLLVHLVPLRNDREHIGLDLVGRLG